MQPQLLNPMTPRQLEKYSSAFTLSDMEIFIFPELMYALVLANVMSPEIWKWRDDKWFAGISRMTPLKKIHRIKQYIMDHYNFNLDLDTWGLTDKQAEIERFSGFIDPDLLARSNALFGYEGDKYYFDIDIRKHFGLDKYDSDIIPYWKTETLEAMNAFLLKPGYETGAGECVSLACLYASALFVVGEIPLENIFLMGTPLHSQNFVLVDEGVLTNNRRIVTKSMWFNGSELSALARRALEHEQVTLVSHLSGYIHSMYPEATIDPEAYKLFREKLLRFLVTSLDYEIFINFLRDYSKHQKLFQVGYPCRGFTKYIALEKAFSYEHGSKNRLGDKGGQKLLCEMEEEDFYLQPMDNRFILNPEDDLFNKRTYQDFLARLMVQFPKLKDNTSFTSDFKRFVHTEPKLPSLNKAFINPPVHQLTSSPIEKSQGHKVTGSQSEVAKLRNSENLNSPAHQFTSSPPSTREEFISYLSALRHPASRIPHPASEIIDLAFYAGRYMDSCDWEPFFKAAFERNPVSVEYFHDHDLEAAWSELTSWPSGSIYSENRMAMPDEVVNFKTGSGLEKVITFLNIARSRHLDITLEQQQDKLFVRIGEKKFQFRWNEKLAFSRRKF